MKKKIKKVKKWLLGNKLLVLVFVIFAFELFLRFYQMDFKNPFGYDQVDNAWAAKNIIVNHWYPLVGMVAKANSGIYIGPLYYYLLSIVYFITNLNPIASGIFAGITSIFTFWIIYVVTKKLMGYETAIIAVIINTFALPAIIFDRIQWPVAFIPALSLVIFYLLYRVLVGDIKKLVPLAITVGLMFNVHFTAIFFPIIILLCLPFFPRKRETIIYALISLPFFIIFIIPNAVYTIINKTSGSNVSYLNTYYHGFHIRRVMQIIGDAFIQFDPYFIIDPLKKIKLIFPLIFAIVYLKKTVDPDKFKFMYLVMLWFVVPWVVFSTYSGEISDYYFSISRFIVLFIVSYLIYSVWRLKNFIPKAIVAVFLIYYIIYNLLNFFPYSDVGLYKREAKVREAISQNKRIEFQVGVPESYLYYYFMMLKGKNVY